MSVICQRCGSIDDFHVELSGPHLKAICNGCDRYIKFISKQELNAHLAAEFPTLLNPQEPVNAPSITMATGMYGSICLEDVFSGQTMKGQDGRTYVCLDNLQGAAHQVGKNGKHYVNIGIWINDEPDQYQNIAGITLSQSKEDREAKAKRTYIGNLKYAQAPQQQAPQQGYAQPVQYGPPPAQAQPWQPGGAPAPQPWQQPAPGGYQQQPGTYPGAAQPQQNWNPAPPAGGGNYQQAPGQVGNVPGQVGGAPYTDLPF